MSIKIDNINQSILRLLQEDTRLSIAAIADSAGISTSPCQKRIKQLESQGVITNYSAHIEVSKICSSVTFLAEITLQEHDKNAFQQFEKVIIEEDTLVECDQVSGPYDYSARFVCKNIEDYKSISDRLLSKSPIKSIQSHCVLSKVKRFAGYPLSYLLDDDKLQ